MKFSFHDEAPRLWAEYGDEIIESWIVQKPGSRPSNWWKFSAPPMQAIPVKYRNCAFAADLREPRQRVGGRGTPRYEVLRIVPEFRCGVPTSWVSDWEIDYYNGRARDVKGERIGTTYRDGNFVAEAFDAADVPRYESQAYFLRRGLLLLPDEARRLRAADFEPETLPQEFWPRDA